MSEQTLNHPTGIDIATVKKLGKSILAADFMADALPNEGAPVDYSDGTKLTHDQKITVWNSST